jgi:hypothetical protein
MMLYQLLKISGVNPEKITALKTGTDLNALYAERDRLNATSGDMRQNRYAVRLAPEPRHRTRSVRRADVKVEVAG